MENHETCYRSDKIAHDDDVSRGNYLISSRIRYQAAYTFVELLF